MIRSLFIALAFLIAAPALAQTYPPLTGRVVDQADLLNPQQEAELTAKLEALEQASSRQLVVLTVPNLGGREIEEYGVGLGRAWRIGQQGANNGVVLIVAVEERKMRIEVGYGLEGIMTDALSSQIIGEMRTHFREGDFPGGINAGADAIIAQLQAPPEAAEARARAAAETRRERRGGGSILVVLFWIIVFVFIIISMIVRGVRGRKYRGRRGRRGPVIIWGPGLGGGGWGSGGGSSSWGGGSWGGGGGGGFSGGGGSFGGGGASGGW